jgi:hypothetical protein
VLTVSLFSALIIGFKYWQYKRRKNNGPTSSSTNFLSNKSTKYSNNTKNNNNNNGNNLNNSNYELQYTNNAFNDQMDEDFNNPFNFTDFTNSNERGIDTGDDQIDYKPHLNPFGSNDGQLSVIKEVPSKNEFNTENNKSAQNLQKIFKETQEYEKNLAIENFLNDLKDDNDDEDTKSSSSSSSNNTDYKNQKINSEPKINELNANFTSLENEININR